MKLFSLVSLSSIVEMESTGDLIDHEKYVIIDDLEEELNLMKKKIKRYKYSEEAFESEMDIVECENKTLGRELDKIKKELKEARDNLQEFVNLENLEIEELEIKQNIATQIIELQPLQENNTNLKQQN